MHGAFDVLPRPGQDRLQGRVADDLTHRAFGHRLYRAFRLLNVEQILFNAFRIGLDLPQHRKVHVDDVFVAGEHQALFRHVANGRSAAQVLHHAHADVDLVDARHLRSEDALDRIGQMVIQPRLHLAHVFAEAQNDADFLAVDTEEPGEQPDRDRGKHDQPEPLAAEGAAGQHRAQPVLAAAQKFLEIGRRRTRRRLSRAPGTFASAA